MLKQLTFLALLSFLMITACTPEDNPLPTDPMGAARVEGEISLPPAYDGDEVVGRRAKFAHSGTVRDYRGEGNCYFVIELSNGEAIVPENGRKLSTKLTEGMRVRFDYKYLRDTPQEGECELGRLARISGITEFRSVGIDR